MSQHSTKSLIELHDFSDASERAYGACIYLRTIDDNGNDFCNLLCAKSRVAPIKKSTISRLELCGALLLAQLANCVAKIINLNLYKLYYWSDSVVALAWIRSEAGNLQRFVGNRVIKIQTLTSKHVWHHVGTADNPADLVSQRLFTKQIKENSLWWHGPAWLRDNTSAWPIIREEIVHNLMEVKQHTAIAVTNTMSNIFFKKYSSFTKMI